MTQLLQLFQQTNTKQNTTIHSKQDVEELE